MLQAQRLFTRARVSFTPCAARWRANDAPGPSTMPTKFSETSAYLRRGRQGVQKLGSNAPGGSIPHPVYGWTPDLGDYYDSEAFTRYKRLSLVLSIAAFCGYFFVFREENDVDAKFTQPLWAHVPTFERQLVIDKIDMARAKGDDTKLLEQQLVKLEQRHDQMNKAAKRTYSPYATPPKE